jgi:hypothetical protein
MSPDARTYWFMLDAAWLRRGLIVELGAEHGPAGPLALVYLPGEAKAANDGGLVHSGYAAVARGIFATTAKARKVIASAVSLGLLDEFTEANEVQFSARIAGWASDQARGHKQSWNDDYQAKRKAKARTEPSAAEQKIIDDLAAKQAREDAAERPRTSPPRRPRSSGGAHPTKE